MREMERCALCFDDFVKKHMVLWIHISPAGVNTRNAGDATPIKKRSVRR